MYHLLTSFLKFVVITWHVPRRCKYLNVVTTLARSMRRTSLIIQHLVSFRRPQRKMEHSSLINCPLVEGMYVKEVHNYIPGRRKKWASL